MWSLAGVPALVPLCSFCQECITHTLCKASSISWRSLFTLSSFSSFSLFSLWGLFAALPLTDNQSSFMEFLVIQRLGSFSGGSRSQPDKTGRAFWGNSWNLFKCILKHRTAGQSRSSCMFTACWDKLWTCHERAKSDCKGAGLNIKQQGWKLHLTSQIWHQCLCHECLGERALSYRHALDPLHSLNIPDYAFSLNSEVLRFFELLYRKCFTLLHFFFFLIQRLILPPSSAEFLVKL